MKITYFLTEIVSTAPKIIQNFYLSFRSPSTLTSRDKSPCEACRDGCVYCLFAFNWVCFTLCRAICEGEHCPGKLPK